MDRRARLNLTYHSRVPIMYFETGADCLRGMMSPGNIVSGHVVSGADCLRGMLSPGAGCLRGRLSPGQIVSGTDCLGAYCLRGTLSPGRIVFGHIVSGWIVSGHHVPPPEKGQRIPKFHLEKFHDYGGGIKFLH